MREFEQAKQEYDNIKIPKELSERIIQEIKHAEKKREMKNHKTKLVSFRRWAAILIGIFIISLNVNKAFAQEMGNVPIIGELAKVLTFRKYEVKTEDYEINVEIPTIEMISEDFTELEETINAEIYALCEQYAEDAKENAVQYREAFLETGGTLEEWIDHDIKIKVWYEVKLQTDKYLSLAVKRAESWNSASAETKIFNINLQTGEQVSYEEVMGTTYYEDNFAVETEAATIYGEKIKEAVANKDLEKLAELTAFPVYMGFLEEGIVIESKDDFIALGTEKIFTEDLITSIANADVSNLEPSMAGFFISGSDTHSGITFGVVDGQLKINGINY